MGKTYSWDDLQPKSAEGYTSSDLEEIPKAIGFLRKALGEEFVANGMHARHPMMFYVVNQAQWTRKWFAQFAKALQSTRHWANGDSLLERIRDPRKFREALSVLRAGVALEGAGFRIEVDPRIDSSKIPDLRIAAPNGDTLLVEVSELGPSQLETGSMNIFYAVTAAIPTGIGLTHAGRLLRTPSQQRAEDLVAQMRACAAAAQEKQQMEIVLVPDFLEFAVAPATAGDALARWALERGLEPDVFSAPSPKISFTGRLVSKINEEMRQLGSGAPSLLWLSMGWTVVLHDNLGESLAEGREHLHRFPRLAGLAVQVWDQGFGADDASSRRAWGIETDKITLVPNDYFAGSLAKETLARLSSL